MNPQITVTLNKDAEQLFAAFYEKHGFARAPEELAEAITALGHWSRERIDNEECVLEAADAFISSLHIMFQLVPGIDAQEHVNDAVNTKLRKALRGLYDGD